MDASEIPSGTPNDLSNMRIGEFQLLRRLGSGGMADVYLAEQTSLGRHVAVKVLKNDAITGGSEVLLRRFEQEARAAGALSHANLVQIITTGREGPIAYIVQEYVQGLNLSQWIKRHGPPDYLTGLKWLQQTAAALRAAAEAGIVHRDVKPENILITRNRVAKVTDFGLAQLNQPNAPRMNLTQVGTTMGTPWYMSPEQIQGEKLDARSDQYSLGITAYHMYAGKPPFSGRNAMTVAVQHLKEEPPLLADIRADLPNELCEVIHRMIRKKPEERFQTSEELEAALNALVEIPVNTTLERPTTLLGRFVAVLPELRNSALALLGVFIAFVLISRVANPRLQLPEKKATDQVNREPTAARQYAYAMLHPDRQDLWKAVMEYYPDSPEADLASLRLGIALMSSTVPDIREAEKAFESVRHKGEIAPEKKHLELLGLIGQAYALSQRPRGAELEEVLSELDQRLESYDDVMQLDLDRAPIELQNFFKGLLRRKQMQSGGDFPDFMGDGFPGGFDNPGFGPVPRPGEDPDRGGRPPEPPDRPQP